jgi:hypothetical protein
MQNEITTTATLEATQSEARFSIGQTFLTRGALDALLEAGQSAVEFLRRHQRGDWGEVGREDQQENEYSLKHGFRILSAYRTKDGTKLWAITEADRSSTTILLPSEY